MQESISSLLELYSPLFIMECTATLTWLTFTWQSSCLLELHYLFSHWHLFLENHKIFYSNLSAMEGSHSLWQFLSLIWSLMKYSSTIMEMTFHSYPLYIGTSLEQLQIWSDWSFSQKDAPTEIIQENMMFVATVIKSGIL